MGFSQHLSMLRLKNPRAQQRAMLHVIPRAELCAREVQRYVRVNFWGTSGKFNFDNRHNNAIMNKEKQNTISDTA
jgi:hypothetical protein